MDDDAVVSVLAAADASSSLPRLGGMARPDGVAIVSDRVWCFSRADGGPVSVRPMPMVRSRLARLPFLRGLVKLGAALVPMFGRGAAARPRERLLLLAALVAPVPLLVVPAGYRTAVLGLVTAAVLVWMFRGRTLKLHGAEHRAIAAAEARSLVATWRGQTRPSRFSPRCGTNFAALLLAVSALLGRVWVPPFAALTPIVLTVVSLMITMELWLAAQRSARPLARLLLWPGLLLQRLTTREPAIEDTRVALRAVAAVLAADRSRTPWRSIAVSPENASHGGTRNEHSLDHPDRRAGVGLARLRRPRPLLRGTAVRSGPPDTAWAARRSLPD